MILTGPKKASKKATRTTHGHLPKTVFRRSPKQMEIMNHIFRGDSAGDFILFEELYKKLSWKASPQALQCSIRFLEEHGLLVRSYEATTKGRALRLEPTVLAYKTLKPPYRPLRPELVP